MLYEDTDMYTIVHTVIRRKWLSFNALVKPIYDAANWIHTVSEKVMKSTLRETIFYKSTYDSIDEIYWTRSMVSHAGWVSAHRQGDVRYVSFYFDLGRINPWFMQSNHSTRYDPMSINTSFRYLHYKTTGHYAIDAEKKILLNIFLTSNTFYRISNHWFVITYHLINILLYHFNFSSSNRRFYSSSIVLKLNQWKNCSLYVCDICWFLFVEIDFSHLQSIILHLLVFWKEIWVEIVKNKCTFMKLEYNLRTSLLITTSEVLNLFLPACSPNAFL